MTLAAQQAVAADGLRGLRSRSPQLNASALGSKSSGDNGQLESTEPNCTLVGRLHTIVYLR